MTALVQPGDEVPDLCREGDTFLKARELKRATACFTSAFETNAASTVSHMRSLESSNLNGVISTLEAWLGIHGESRAYAIEGVHKGLAAVFLSTLSPNNLSASLFKMESLLQKAPPDCEEIVARCAALLEGKRCPRPEGSTRVMLELTQALACFLSEPQNTNGLKLYLKAYQANKLETIRLVKCRQAQHLPKIVSSFSEHIFNKRTNPLLTLFSDDHEFDSAMFLDFLISVSPGDLAIQELQAAFLFSVGRFEDSAKAYSLALHDSYSNKKTGQYTERSFQGAQPERRACLLTCRAAAYFSAGGRALEACRDLGEAFEAHPATARQQFLQLFVDQGTETAARVQLRQQAERGLLGYREKILVCPDLRSTEGLELLGPVTAQFRALCHLQPDGGSRELRVRLAECLLLRGEHREVLSICNQLVAAVQAQQSYQNTIQVLCGYARLLSDDHKGAMEDFQAVIEHNTPHPTSCVRALCGRGILRMLANQHYLTALDYVTASRLQHQDTALTVRCLVPWNYRGLLFTILLEQGRIMLEGTVDHNNSANPANNSREGTPTGVHSLALLLMELQPTANDPQILATDAMYQLGRVEEAYRLLLAIGPANPPQASILARLALMQLHRGFLYDANQLLKKLIQCGDTSCLCSLFAVACHEDRALLQQHCHSASKRILEGMRDDGTLREAVAYLSIAIMASGGGAAEPLLERARCYVLLGQHKTAIFDFSAIIKEHPEHIQALCGRGFTYLMFHQQKDCTRDILAALQISTDAVIKEILALKDKARSLMCDWLQQHCQAHLNKIVAAPSWKNSCLEEQLRDAFLIGGTLMRTDCKEPRWHLLYVDILFAKGEAKAAGAHLTQVFGQEPRDAVAQARVGVVKALQQNYNGAALLLSKLADKEPSTLDFLLTLIPPRNRNSMAQTAAQEAKDLSLRGKWNQALTLLNIAVKGADQTRPQYLRQRASCLAQLGLHKLAVIDLEQVILTHTRSNSSSPDDLPVLVEDLCMRGRSLVLCSREKAALDDFSQALELHRALAIQSMEAGLGRLCVADCFLRGALQLYAEQQLSKALNFTQNGLILDIENAELRRLKAKVKRESSCNVH